MCQLIAVDKGRTTPTATALPTRGGGQFMGQALNPGAAHNPPPPTLTWRHKMRAEGISPRNLFHHSVRSDSGPVPCNLTELRGKEIDTGRVRHLVYMDFSGVLDKVQHGRRAECQR